MNRKSIEQQIQVLQATLQRVNDTLDKYQGEGMGLSSEVEVPIVISEKGEDDTTLCVSHLRLQVHEDEVVVPDQEEQVKRLLPPYPENGDHSS
jgi:hypothetical protein